MSEARLRTDLAMETMADARCDSGVKSEKSSCDGVERQCVTVENDRASRALGKAVGRYVTFSAADMCRAEMDEEARRKLAGALARDVRGMLPAQGDVMVVGLGNRHITADALGDRVVERVLVTRHMLGGRETDGLPGMRSVCAVAPGVMGVTGIETAEMVRGVVDRVRPAAVVVIDALAARELKCICTTIQVTDTGISPGSGVGNHRVGLNRRTLGVPVVAVGVPMVVYASVIARDALSVLTAQSGLKEGEKERAVASMMEDVMRRMPEDMVVTPRQVDELVGRVASVIALGINQALQPELSEMDILTLTNDHWA